MQLKKLIQNYSNFILVSLLAGFSFLINFNYGFIGLMPMDNTVLFNGGFRVLNGYVPFSDYWLVTGPLLDYLNAFFFKILGLSWKTFIIHSSLINLLLAVTSFYFFINLEVPKIFSFFYSLLISILFYPVVGTPFVDHHSTFFLVLSFYFLIISIKYSKYNYFFFIPSILLLSFLSKQTPAVYGIISITILVLFLYYIEKRLFKKIVLNSILGTLISLALLLFFFLVSKIEINNFILQYLFFASSIGGDRLDTYHFNLFNELDNYKFIYFFVFLLAFLILKIVRDKIQDKKNLFVIICSITLSLVLIFHQMITLNQNFIFFIIPFLCAVFHSFYQKIYDRKIFLFIPILICIFSVTKYHLRFNEERKFNELEKVDISKAVDAEVLDNKLKGLKWITYLNPENPYKEINDIREILRILKDEGSSKMIITEYQIIAPILGVYDNSPNQWHHPSVSFPLNKNKYFELYKDFFVSKVKKYKINFIFETRSDNNTITELVLSPECYFSKKERISNMLIRLKINKNCEDFK